MDILENVRTITKIESVLENAITLPKVGSYDHPRECDGFIFILRGSARYYFEREQFTVRQSNVLYLSKGARYVIEKLTDDYRFIYINFFFSPAEQANSAVYSVDDASLYENLFRMADKSWLEGGHERKIRVFSIVYEIYARLLLHRKRAYSPTSSQRMNGVQKYLLTHYANPELRIADLCRECNLSEEQLRRLFKNCYGVSPMHYLNQLRVERAKALLEQGDCNQQTIADLCGFSDVYYFGKVFKKVCGMSPGKYAQLKNDRKVQI